MSTGRTSGSGSLEEHEWALALLGGFRLEREGQEIALPPGAQRLLAFLALHHRPLQRVFVAGSLWIDSSEEHANANLRTTLWRLGQLGRRLVDSTKSHVGLHPAVAVDLRAANTLAHRLLRADGGVRADDVATIVDEGALLPDWYEDWVVIEREQHRQLRLYALEALCRRLAAAGCYGAAVEVGLACVAAEPLRESGHRAVMEVHLAEGNSAEAIRQFRLYRALARERLGLEPSAQMRAMLG